MDSRIKDIITKLEEVSKYCEPKQHDNLKCLDCGYTWETSVKHFPGNPFKEPVCPKCGSTDTVRSPKA